MPKYPTGCNPSPQTIVNTARLAFLYQPELQARRHLGTIHLTILTALADSLDGLGEGRAACPTSGYCSKRLIWS